MAILGYARVSTNGQDLTGQMAELQAARCVKIYREKASGAKTDRPELAKLLRALEPGDVLIVTRLDRLARSTRDLLNVLDAVAKAKAGFRSLKDTWADTTTPAWPPHADGAVQARAFWPSAKAEPPSGRKPSSGLPMARRSRP